MQLNRWLKYIPDTGVPDGHVGFEIEIEGEGISYYKGKYWEGNHDYSLQGHPEAIEYVLSKPMDFEAFNLAVKDLWGYLKDSKINESPRAGVHCHVNVQQMSAKGLVNFITAYYILEEALVKWCGPNREGNLFCLRLMDADSVVDRLLEVFSHRDARMFNDDVRYAALNFASLSRHGTLEFRAMETRDSPEDMIAWAGMLLSIKDNSQKFDNAVGLIEQGSFMGPLDLAQVLLGEYYDTILKCWGGPIEFEKAVLRGLRLAQEVAYLSEIKEVDNNPFRGQGFNHIHAIYLPPHPDPLEILGEEDDEIYEDEDYVGDDF